VLSENDFTELVVADPTTESDPMTNTLQTLFTKPGYGKNGLELTHSDLAKNLIRAMTEQHRTTRFMLKQLVLTAGKSTSNSSNSGRTLQELQARYTHLKQASNSDRIRSDQKLADLQKRLQAMSASAGEKDKELRKLQAQNTHLREIVKENGAARRSSSAGAGGSGGGGRGGPSGASISGGRSVGSLGSAGSGSRNRGIPLQNIVIQQQSRGGGGGAPYHLGGGGMVRPVSHSGVDSVITPIQAPTYHPHHNNRRPASSGGSVASSYEQTGIRDFTDSSGFVFSRRSSGATMNVRPSSSSSLQHQQQPPSKYARHSYSSRGGGYGRR